MRKTSARPASEDWPDFVPVGPSEPGDVSARSENQLEGGRGGRGGSLEGMFRQLEGLDLVVKENDQGHRSEPTPRRFSPDYFNAKLQTRLYRADAFELMEAVARKCAGGCVDLIVTDPPYFLSNGGVTCVAGRMVSVNKGDWDKSRGVVADHEFTKGWLRLCRTLLKPNGSIWVTGTMHVIYSVGFAMQELGYRILNDVVWWKTNPAPHLACRYLQHATEIILWAKKSERSRHVFHYGLMKELNNGKQMQNVWRFASVSRQEKELGGHPTQKPVALMRRIIECSSNEGDLVFDPFMGAGTTGVACALSGRKFVGCELEEKYFRIAVDRIEAIARMSKQGRLFEHV